MTESVPDRLNFSLVFSVTLLPPEGPSIVITLSNNILSINLAWPIILCSIASVKQENSRQQQILMMT